MADVFGGSKSTQFAVSLIIDEDPIFAYTAWHLVHSIAEHTPIDWPQIHVQLTPEVSDDIAEQFGKLGCSVHRLARFGDGRFCNKLAQWENLDAGDADHFVFLDTDMICIGDFTADLPLGAVGAKVVDLANPPVRLLKKLFKQAGFKSFPAKVRVEATRDKTYRGNCNGGFYSVPAAQADRLFEAWRRHALGLLAQIEPLEKAGKANHVDQISFCMAIHETGLPFAELSSNLNYYVHFAGKHGWRDPQRPITLLHYHNSSLNVLGLLEPAGAVEEDEIAAVEKANRQIEGRFPPELFWSMRYKHFPERGSGVGSRGPNLEYKRDLLVAQGIEGAKSVLDVGCGDLEVVGSLDLQNYVGVDRSTESLTLAKQKRPDWSFLLAPALNAPTSDFVICFEVLIHQNSEEEYRNLIDFMSSRAGKTLIVSGYEGLTEAISANHMIFFHEPLEESLKNTGRFSSVRKIGAHSDVAVFRCDV